MMNVQTVWPSIQEGKIEIPYQDADDLFTRLYKQYPHHFLMESKQVSLFSGRFSLIGIDAALKLTGKDDHFRIESLHERGQIYLDQLSDELFTFCDSFQRKSGFLTGTIKKDKSVLEESQRSHLKNVAQVIRLLLENFSCEQKVLMGLYGAFSYDFIRLFEDLHDALPENDTADFSLQLYDSFLFFDHIKEQAFIILYRENEQELKKDSEKITMQLQGKSHVDDFEIKDHSFATSQEDFEAMVHQAKQYIKEGELFQVVFSNILKADFSGDPFALYQAYREKNPSPYLFYYDLGDEQLVGASPEMMVRCEEGLVHLRPIAGTIHRGEDPIDDHDQMVELLSNPKERAELDMLIDLGRNDLSRICKPKIHIDDYRFVERYSRVMHTVAHLTGELEQGYSGLDALISCLNAGTLTGAPKVQAMRTIEQHEQERRGYYGGAVGQLTFSGEVDTAIMIRTAHIKDGFLRYQSGAGIVYDSDPTSEFQEVMNKAQAFLDTIVTPGPL